MDYQTVTRGPRPKTFSRQMGWSYRKHLRNAYRARVHGGARDPREAGDFRIRLRGAREVGFYRTSGVHSRTIERKTPRGRSVGAFFWEVLVKVFSLLYNG